MDLSQSLKLGVKIIHQRKKVDRLLKNKEHRQMKRNDLVSAIRHISDSPLRISPKPEKKMTRLELLRKWQEERNKSKAAEKSKIKPAFKVSHVSEKIYEEVVKLPPVCLKKEPTPSSYKFASSAHKFRVPPNIKPLHLDGGRESEKNAPIEDNAAEKNEKTRRKLNFKMNNILPSKENLDLDTVQAKTSQREKTMNRKIGSVPKPSEPGTSHQSKATSKISRTTSKISRTTSKISKTTSKISRTQGSAENLNMISTETSNPPNVRLKSARLIAKSNNAQLKTEPEVKTKNSNQKLVRQTSSSAVSKPKLAKSGSDQKQKSDVTVPKTKVQDKNQKLVRQTSSSAVLKSKTVKSGSDLKQKSKTKVQQNNQKFIGQASSSAVLKSKTIKSGSDLKQKSKTKVQQNHQKFIGQTYSSAVLKSKTVKSGSDLKQKSKTKVQQNNQKFIGQASSSAVSEPKISRSDSDLIKKSDVAMPKTKVQQEKSDVSQGLRGNLRSSAVQRKSSTPKKENSQSGRVVPKNADENYLEISPVDKKVMSEEDYGLNSTFNKDESDLVTKETEKESRSVEKTEVPHVLTRAMSRAQQLTTDKQTSRNSLVADIVQIFEEGDPKTKSPKKRQIKASIDNEVFSKSAEFAVPVVKTPKKVKPKANDENMNTNEEMEVKNIKTGSKTPTNRRKSLHSDPEISEPDFTILDFNTAELENYLEKISPVDKKVMSEEDYGLNSTFNKDESDLVTKETEKESRSVEKSEVPHVLTRAMSRAQQLTTDKQTSRNSLVADIIQIFEEGVPKTKSLSPKKRHNKASIDNEVFSKSAEFAVPVVKTPKKVKPKANDENMNTNEEMEVKNIKTGSKTPTNRRKSLHSDPEMLFTNKTSSMIRKSLLSEIRRFAESSGGRNPSFKTDASLKSMSPDYPIERSFGEIINASTPNAKDIDVTPDNDKQAINYVSPYVTMSRGKNSARKEFHKRQSKGGLCDASSEVTGVKAGAAYFYKVLDDKILWIQNMCQEWTTYKTKVPESMTPVKSILKTKEPKSSVKKAVLFEEDVNKEETKNKSYVVSNDNNDENDVNSPNVPSPIDTPRGLTRIRLF